jgi:hypothetical protein
MSRQVGDGRVDRLQAHRFDGLRFPGSAPTQPQSLARRQSTPDRFRHQFAANSPIEHTDDPADSLIDDAAAEGFLWPILGMVVSLHHQIANAL